MLWTLQKDGNSPYNYYQAIVLPLEDFLSVDASLEDGLCSEDGARSKSHFQERSKKN
jgi:hypothetical protein